MIELIIYWTGVVTLISLGLLVTLFSVYLIFCGLLQLLCKELRSTYNHVQLYYFMGKIKELGYAQAMHEQIKEEK